MEQNIPYIEEHKNVVFGWLCKEVWEGVGNHVQEWCKNEYGIKDIEEYPPIKDAAEQALTWMIEDGTILVSGDNLIFVNEDDYNSLNDYCMNGVGFYEE